MTEVEARGISGDASLKLGLNLPMFLASLVALFSGIFGGIFGVWLYGAWKIAVPEYIKVGHAHGAWWAVLILLAGLLLPSATLKRSVKRFVIITSFVAVPLWMVTLAAYYISKTARGALVPLPTRPGEEYSLEYLTYGTGIFVIEVWLFVALALVFLSAMGLRLPRISQSSPSQSRFDLLTKIELPRRVFRMPILCAALGLAVGWAMTIVFKARGLPIAPAALVQLHSHTFFFLVGYLLTLLTMRVVGAHERLFNMTYRLGLVALPLLVIGWILFNVLKLPSLIHVVPALLYFAILFLGLAALCGAFGLVDSGELHLHFVRGSMIFTWVLMMALVTVGPLIALGWDTHPDVTVTYKQPDGSPYPGPYPEKYTGTASVTKSPRGLENLHLSPGSWSHVALGWLLTLLLIGEHVGKILNRPTLIFLIASTIPLAPLFNAFGRVAAWADLPAGIGGMWFAAHPLKFFNVIILAVITLAMMYRLNHQRSSN